MKIAIPTWQANVSPVFDVAQQLLLAEVEGCIEQRRRVESLGELGVLARAGRLRDLSVNLLICGALSWPLEQTLASSGIQVIPHVCGNVDEVLRAYLTGRLWDRVFLMPGCDGRPRLGRMGGPYAAGPSGYCVCPQCGQRVTHASGQPCNERTCPKCGERMTRG